MENVDKCIYRISFVLEIKIGNFYLKSCIFINLAYISQLKIIFIDSLSNSTLEH